MFQRKAKIVGFAQVVILTGCVALLLEANRSGRVLAAEGDEAKGRPLLQARSPFDIASAYHYRYVEYNFLDEEEAPLRVVEIREVCAVRGVGRRAEIRQGPKLVSVVVDTPRWRFSWDVGRNRVVASPSHLQDPGTRMQEDLARLMYDRERVIRDAELLTGIFVCQKEQIDGREVEKITAYYPGDPFADRFCAHGFYPKAHLQSSGTQFWSRLYWFDRKSGCLVQRRCGCKRRSWEIRIDYPEPESVPKELFTFQVPRSAVLEVSDPGLGRLLYSEGETGPDLPQ